MKNFKLFLALISATLVLTACGGSSSGGNGGSSSSSSSSSSSGGPVSCAENLPSFVTCTEGDAESDPDIYTVSGLVDEDFTIDMEATKTWRIDGTVTVGNGNETTVNSDADVTALQAAGVTLTIEAGVHVGAFDDAKLIVTRGSMIDAQGTAAMPITFSSVIDEDFDGEGEWGGIVIQGFAPQYGAGDTGPCYLSGTTCNVQGEGGDDIGVYGGNIEDDNSGTIRYVRIAEGGLVAGPGNEVNGLTLQGVGYGTTIEYVQVHGNLDDGIEWFGGTVNVKYAVLTNNDDDDIDFDEGFVGNIQYAIVVKNQTRTAPSGDNDPRGIEANSSNTDYVPQTNAVLANITIIGGAVNNAAGSEQPGMRLRGALTTAIYNSAVEGFDEGCVQIDDADTGSEIVESDVTLVNVLGDCAGGFYNNEVADSATNAVAATFSLDDTYAIVEAVGVLPSAQEIAAVGNSGFTFDETDYVGAVEPGTTAVDAWWAGWTLPGTLTDVSEEEQPDETPAFVTCADDICTINDDIDQDYTLVPSVEWRIDGTVTVGNGNTTNVSDDDDVEAVRNAGVTLTINPGVHVRAFDDAKLIITRGSKIMAEGLSYAPITFSSAIDDDIEGLGEWGGIVVQGFAPQYGAGNTGACYGTGTTCNVQGEGGDDIGVYGGNDPADNSGVIRYVRIAEGGLVAGPGNEVNGLTLQGVGHGTTVEYVQVHGNLDDGVEWFGGTVNVKYLVLTNNDDDDIDFDEGYQGNIQYAIVRKHPAKEMPSGDNDPRGIEANSSDADYVTQTNAVLSNITLIGSDIADGQWGMRLRGALTTAIHNTAIVEFDNGCVRIDDADTDGDEPGTEIAFSDVTFNNVIGNCDAGFYSHESADTEMGTVGAAAITLDAAWAIVEEDGQLDAPVDVTALDNGSDFEFDSTDYIGAVEPGTSAANAWWAGWTFPGTLD